MRGGNTDFSVATLIMQQADRWAQQEKDNNQSLAGAVLRHMEDSKKMRLPQRKAIEVQLWLKFRGGNKNIADLIADGGLTNDCGINARTPQEKFLYLLAEKNNLPALKNEILNRNFTVKKNAGWDEDLRRLFGDYSYPHRVFSLPMGAGKTYLMAAMICLDLYFSRSLPDDKRFAHNFVVFAPHASKTAILPSLKTIREFDPGWILPPADAEAVRQELHIEVLDSATQKNNMRVNNPNLEKINRLAHTRTRGLVFITNAEKVVLEKYSINDQVYVNMGAQEKEAFKKQNALRERMAEIPALAVYLDEVHHSADKDKKLRQAVNILAQHGNLREVCGFSGTPFIEMQRITLGSVSVKTRRIIDVVYDYPLAHGIGVFLKTPEVKSHDSVREETFIHGALTHFFQQYDKTYPNGAKSKIAFYCPTVQALNEQILPMVHQWYDKNRKNKNREREILSYYTSHKDYPLPATALTEFHHLDSPHSQTRIILLVAVGTEGWDCKSLTGVVLPRVKTPKNFVLQTSCRCLREVENAAGEKALIWLSHNNYTTLEAELKEYHDTTIKAISQADVNSVPVVVRKAKLGKLNYTSTRYMPAVEIKQESQPVARKLKQFTLTPFYRQWSYNAAEQITAAISRKHGGMEATRQRVAATTADFAPDSWSDFITAIQQALWGQLTAAELEQQHGKKLQQLYSAMCKKRRWFAAHPRGSRFIWDEAIKSIAACFAEEVEYKRETLTEPVQLELLEWHSDNERIGWGSGIFIPEIRQMELPKLNKRRERLEEDLEDDRTDVYDISFNYLPYRFDSQYEKDAIQKMLQEAALSDLELYYNGMKHEQLDSFAIQTPAGRYTPDFLLIKRKGKPRRMKPKTSGRIAKVLIIETKGKIFYDDNFRRKEKFIKEEFIRQNPHFHYECFVDEGSGDFKHHLDSLRDKVAKWQKGPL